MVVVLLAILVPVILFTVVLKDDEKNEHEARPQCNERNTKEIDMMRRFSQINTNFRTNGDQNLSATELFFAYKDLSEEFTKEAF